MNKKPPVVKTHLRGTAKISVNEFRKALGLITFETWLAYIWRRNEEGESFASARSIAREKNHSLSSVNRACKKLMQIKLIQSPAWINSGKRSHRYRRIVFGDYRENIITIPRETFDLLDTLPKHGGKRTGAGRKKINQTGSINAPKNSDDLIIQDDYVVNQNGSINSQEELHESSTITDTKNQNGSLDLIIQDDSIKNQDDTALKSILKSNIIFYENNAEQVPPIMSVELPPFPSAKLLLVARLPSPKVLGQGLSDRECVERMVTAYRGAITSRYKKTSYAFTRGDLTRSRFYRGFVSASEFLREYEIAPASWCAFSVDAWREYMNSKKEPGANWVYSIKRLEEKQDWYENELVSYRGGRLIFSDEHKTILRKYEALKKQTMQVELTDELIRKFFPHGWETAYEQATRANKHTQERLNDLVNNGKFIW